MFKESALGNLLFLSFPVLGVLAGILVSRVSIFPMEYNYALFIFHSVGFSLFTMAKISTILGGQLITFGPYRMTKRNKALYKLGYALMAIGLFLTIFLIGIP